MVALLLASAVTIAYSTQPPMQKAPLYHESLRPQFHFTARQWTVDLLQPQRRQEGWINDLNGMIYYDGEWHLFAQRWAICWLHAVSKDLIHWTELQPAFWEESDGSGVQSGTCVVDYENASGLAKDKKHPAMVAFWSRFDNHSQCLCYSLDRGRTWTRYPGNPIFDKPERDPKVFWYGPKKGRWGNDPEGAADSAQGFSRAGRPTKDPAGIAESSQGLSAATPLVRGYPENRTPEGCQSPAEASLSSSESGGHWVMVMYGGRAYHILTSPDLLHWKDEKNPIPNSFECPDFFELPLDGDPAKRKWVLMQGSGNYSIGTFDGRKFTEETPRRPVDIGPSFYATQTFHNTETSDGRRIQCAWMQSPDFPKMPFNQQISFPCELTLHSTPDGPRVFRQPIRELKKLEGKAMAFKARTLAAGESLPLSASGDLYRLRAEVEISEGAKLVFRLRGDEVVLTAKIVENGTKPADVRGGVKSIEILLDRASIEAFVNGGEVSSTRTVFLKEEGLSVRAEGGPVKIKKLTLTPLKSIWP